MYNIISAGLDHSIASIDIREKFSLTKSKQIDFYNHMKTFENVHGCTIISTCNRTEIYLSLEENAEVNPFEVLCNFVGVDIEKSDLKYKIYKGSDVIHHLCMLACGAKSQIFGEDQIITQIKTSIILSRECDMTDSLMEVLFRTGISCGKKIKTNLNMTKRETSIADYVLEKLENECENVKTLLVIGNGEMGKHMATKLVQNKYDVTMSVREHAHSKIILPCGCKGVDFTEIYDKMQECDAVVSATLSPHYTIKRDIFANLNNKPQYLFDLAMPRDIDPSIKEMQDIKMWDVDSLSKNITSENRKQLLADMEIIIKKYISDFEKWVKFKEKLDIF